MSARVCPHCRRPLPVPSSGSPAPGSCPFCFARLDGSRGPTATLASVSAPTAAPRPAPSLAAPGMTQPVADAAARRVPVPPASAARGPESARAGEARDEPSVGKKRAEAFASALLVENAARKTPVHAFAVPPEAIPVANTPRRRGSTPPPGGPAGASASLATAAAQARAAVPAPAPAPAPVMPAAPAAGAPGRTMAFAAVSSVAPARAPAPPVVAVSGRPAPVPTPASASATSVPTLAPILPQPAAALNGRTQSRMAVEPVAAPIAASPPRPAVGDEWNIRPYLEELDAQNATQAGAKPAGSAPDPLAGAVHTPPTGATPQPLASPASEPIDVDLRGGLPALLRRLPMRGIGATLGSAVIVVLLGAGGLKLFGGALRSEGGKVATASRPGSSSSKSTGSASPLPSLVMPSTLAGGAEAPPAEAAAARSTAPRRGSQTAPPATDRDEARSAASPPVSAKERARLDKKERALATRAARIASSTRVAPASRRRGSSRASASASSDAVSGESEKMTRAREAYRRGNAKLFAGDATAAMTAYEEAVRLNPKDAAGYRGLGLASAQLGKRTEAVRYLRTYLKRAPSAEDRAIISGRISLLQTLP